MQKIILCFFSLTLFTTGYAQVPEDALRYSWYPQNGTARVLAIGGAMGSLGGDLTAAYVNPAGLGFFKTGEFVFSPAYFSARNQSRYRDAESNSNRPGFILGPTGIILGSTNKRNPANSSAFSFSIQQSAGFRNKIQYSALNNYSSYSEQFVESFSKSGYSIQDVLNSNSPMPYDAAVSLFTYLIDTVTINGQTIVKAAPEYLLDSGYALQQDFLKTTGGGIYDFSIAFAQNIKDKLLLGASVGIPFVHYTSNTRFTETDTSSNIYNHFKSFTYTDAFTTSGTGFNVKLGAIYRPTEYIRLGLSVHTPTYMFLTDKRSTTLYTQLESNTGQPESYSVSSKTFTNGKEGESRYTQTSPWKALISASYVFREVENVKKQKGFITADIEYVNHRGSRFSSDNEAPTAAEKTYYKALNDTVKQEYKGAFNFRVGGELKFNILMARLGLAYYSNPYKKESFKANQLLLSGGLGYRNKGFFADLTYVYRISKDGQYTYRLDPPVNNNAHLAITKQKQGNVAVTVGLKF